MTNWLMLVLLVTINTIQKGVEREPDVQGFSALVLSRTNGIRDGQPAETPRFSGDVDASCCRGAHGVRGCSGQSGLSGDHQPGNVDGIQLRPDGRTAARSRRGIVLPAVARGAAPVPGGVERLHCEALRHRGRAPHHRGHARENAASHGGPQRHGLSSLQGFGPEQGKHLRFPRQR